MNNNDDIVIGQLPTEIKWKDVSELEKKLLLWLWFIFSGPNDNSSIEVEIENKT